CDNSYNYDPLEDLSCHLMSYKFTKQQLANIAEMTASGCTSVEALIDKLREDEEDYLWALTCITKLFNKILKPCIIVTDKKLAFMDALIKIVPGSTNLLCL
ncbi:12273_t:CDS:2, partial [Cetraspora pellucida]